MEYNEIMQNSKNNLENFFNPQSIAIVGATEKEGKVGKVVVGNILNLGYSGEVFLVNPKHTELFGKKCYSGLEEIDKKVDLAIIIIPAKFVNDTIKSVAEKIKNFVIISAGFSEIGKEGRKREIKLAELAKKNDLNILGPNCLGFISPKIKLNASFAGGMPKKGKVAFISQSGALAVAFMDMAEKEGVKFSNLVSMGNKAQIDEADLMEYFYKDEATRAIAIYIEGIKDGKKFMKIASKISVKKPIIILKAGKTEKSQAAISSHTGALAGSNAIMDAVFNKTGVLQASSLDNFFSLIKLVSEARFIKNNQAIIVTNAGGPGVLTADAFKHKGIKLAEISEETKNKLKKILPEESSLENPIDLLGDARDDRYEKTLKVISQEEAGMVICVLTPQDQTPCEKIARKIIDFNNNTNKTTVAVFIGGEKIEKALNILKEGNIPNFSFPEMAIETLDKYCQWNSRSTSFLDISTEEKNNHKRATTVENIITKAKQEKRKALLFSEAKNIMDLYGINSVETISVRSGTEMELSKLKFPVVVKIDSAEILHKTDRKGVILSIKNQEELEASLNKMGDNFPEENIIIQPMLKVQMELIMGIKKDDVFGPVIICGLGGIYTEIFKTVEFFIPPLSLEEIKNRLLKSKIGFLFKETRGKDPYNINEVVEILMKLASLAQEINCIKEVDINPLLIYNNGKRAKAIDIKIITI